ncbi:hypothetical protein PISMIDRAFT_479021 [Pisolithus microcarpus 441]|uniref:Secreted protein n=1 Tax=Pisolithus microcarpus 441 TaxID=765257 RepID=A0A0D0ABG5_9AGAM|nr:hypothetical protein BKA83DRAFT_479021 [Pisolithus microcarpus]KIK29373.1 hypothetical protein PISMIDRAFT_479021 [Pisolithus microcarpus 441]
MNRVWQRSRVVLSFLVRYLYLLASKPNHSPAQPLSGRRGDVSIVTCIFSRTSVWTALRYSSLKLHFLLRRAYGVDPRRKLYWTHSRV